MAPKRVDLTVIGGGIVGLSTAMQIAGRYPRLKLLLVEKEKQLATHQTGHNSGVIHSGIYYRPGSLKAQTCVAGRAALLEFCDRYGIPYDLCGKVIVATREEEIPQLEELRQRGTENGVKGLEIIGPERLREMEPHAHGIRALYAPGSGIVDFTRVAQGFASKIQEMGGEVLTSHEVIGIVPRDGGLMIETPAQEIHSRYLINCAGLFADHVARITERGQRQISADGLRIVPFRGEYYRLIPERKFLVRGLIYPVPNPSLPFLGVHFGRNINGEVKVGPNAVLALAREGYRKTDVDVHDLWNLLSYRGFWSLAGHHWSTGLDEIHRSLSKRAFVKSVQRLIPDLKGEDLMAGGSGVRAQAVSSTGALIDDFVLRQSANVIHVLNAPSPGATASLAIGKVIVESAAKAFSLDQ